MFIIMLILVVWALNSLIAIWILTQAGIISIALFAFLMSWNEFVLASVLTNTDNSKTLPIGLSEFATMFTVDWGSTMAAAFLMTVPVVAVFLLFQKQFVSGLSAGAVKGEPTSVPRRTLTC
jgi:multiple sugar transport system permease protein